MDQLVHNPDTGQDMKKISHHPEELRALIYSTPLIEISFELKLS